MLPWALKEGQNQKISPFFKTLFLPFGHHHRKRHAAAVFTLATKFQLFTLCDLTSQPNLTTRTTEIGRELTSTTEMRQDGTNTVCAVAAQLLHIEACACHDLLHEAHRSSSDSYCLCSTKIGLSLVVSALWKRSRYSVQACWYGAFPMNNTHITVMFLIIINSITFVS